MQTILDFRFNPALRADILRLAILKLATIETLLSLSGGGANEESMTGASSETHELFQVYSDVDMLCLKSFDQVLETFGSFRGLVFGLGNTAALEIFNAVLIKVGNEPCRFLDGLYKNILKSIQMEVDDLAKKAAVEQKTLLMSGATK
mmetsp:Transcript_29805/g.45463  ORF Transcript_29805/g.45463 Transcript_29805/m.45463 type:complete len:147 (+) Transcript_29805:307-747(+)